MGEPLTKIKSRQTKTLRNRKRSIEREVNTLDRKKKLTLKKARSLGRELGDITDELQGRSPKPKRFFR